MAHHAPATAKMTLIMPASAIAGRALRRSMARISEPPDAAADACAAVCSYEGGPASVLLLVE